ncbi:MAG: hypothetical protein GY774_35645 [Planctomycetes bacterium]|nr:hypothetical protein [Planctomycetota bacterium]
MNKVKFPDLDDYVMGVNRKFGRVMESDVGYFKVLRTGTLAFIVSPAYFEQPHEDAEEWSCFTEIIGDIDDTIDGAFKSLKEYLESWFLSQLGLGSDLEFREKILLWRICPEIVKSVNLEMGVIQYRGYTRLAIIDKKGV